MPTYEYKCKACGITKEVFHPMSELDKPSEKTIQETSCAYNNRACLGAWKNFLDVLEIPSKEDLKFERVISSPYIMGSYGGTSLSGQEKTKAIQKERKKRSTENFKKEIFPTLGKKDKKHFENKWKKNGGG
jgi:hypothetical protein